MANNVNALNASRVKLGAIEGERIILHILGEDNKTYFLSMTADAIAEAITSLLQGANSLPMKNQTKGSGVLVNGSLTFAVGEDLQPILVVGFGGAEIPIVLSESQLASLHADIAQHLGISSQKH